MENKIISLTKSLRLKVIDATKEYKTYKGLTKENLRDNMTNTELVLNMLTGMKYQNIL